MGKIYYCEWNVDRVDFADKRGLKKVQNYGGDPAGRPYDELWHLFMQQSVG